MVFVQKWPFFQLLFLENIGQESIFYDTLEGKNAFLGYKKEKFKKLNILTFFNMYYIDMAIFRIFFLSNIGEENVFYDIPERKNAILGYKNKKFKKWKN